MGFFKAVVGITFVGIAIFNAPSIFGIVTNVSESFLFESEPQAAQDTPLIGIEKTSSNIMKAAYVLESFLILNPTADRENFRIGDGYIESSKSEGLVVVETEMEAIAKSENLPSAMVTFNADYKGFKLVTPNESNPASPKILYDSIDEELSWTLDGSNNNSW